jgi:hypothetical protein
VIDAADEKPRSDDRQAGSEDQQRPIRLQVAELLGGGREAILEHAGQD